MERTIEQRLAILEAEGLATNVVIIHMLRQIGDRDTLAKMRDDCCRAIEAIYGASLNPGGHEQIQRVIAGVEGIFQGAGLSLGQKPPAPDSRE